MTESEEKVGFSEFLLVPASDTLLHCFYSKTIV